MMLTCCCTYTTTYICYQPNQDLNQRLFVPWLANPVANDDHVGTPNPSYFMALFSNTNPKLDLLMLMCPCVFRFLPQLIPST